MLPLFPLPVVLFPGGFMPLHIFEPRYRALVADCVAGDHRFGILPPGETTEEPPAGTIGSIARIRGIQPLPDGRSHIVVSGDARFLLQRLVPSEKPYLVGETTEIDDDPDVQVPTAADLTALQQLGERYAAALLALEDGEREFALSPDPGLLTFQIAGLLEWDRETKQRFLENRSRTNRVVRLLHALPNLVEGIEGRARLHRRAVTNGSAPR